jgi:hypothetical protein
VADHAGGIVWRYPSIISSYLRNKKYHLLPLLNYYNSESCATSRVNVTERTTIPSQGRHRILNLKYTGSTNNAEVQRILEGRRPRWRGIVECNGTSDNVSSIRQVEILPGPEKAFYRRVCRKRVSGLDRIWSLASKNVSRKMDFGRCGQFSRMGGNMVHGETTECSRGNGN